MAGFDPVVIMIGVLAAVIIVLLIRMLAQSNTQSAGAALRSATVASGPPFSGQGLSDLAGKPPGPRPGVSRAEQTPLQTIPTPATPDRDSVNVSLLPFPPAESVKGESTPEMSIPSSPEPAARAAVGGEKEKEQELEQAPMVSANYGRRKSDMFKEETVHNLFSDLKRERKARFISFINFKGGVGKSTTAVETAASLAKNYGKRVLLIDLDPQTNATFYLMDHAEWESWQQTNGSLKTLFDAYLAGQGDSFDVSRIIKKDLLCHGGTPLAPGFELLPSHLALVQIDIQLAAKATIGEAVFSSQAIIRQALQSVQDQYDYVIFDCPPNFNLVTQNGLFASDGYVIPAIPDYLSTLGINLIQGEVNRFSDRIRNALAMFGGTFAGPELKGIIFTRVRLRSRSPLRFIDLHERRIHEVVRTNPDVVFKNFISEAVRFAEAPERQLPVSLSPRIEDRDARNEFIRLAEEFIQRVDGKELSGDIAEHAWASTEVGEYQPSLARAS
jgi:chromosome partitioning protein